METPERAAQRIFGERSAFYAGTPVHKDPEVLKHVIGLAAPRIDEIALDVATGSGHTAAALAPHLANVVCVDITRQMLAQAEKMAIELNIHNMTLCLADAHELPFHDNEFDIVTCRRAPHHFSDLMEALREIRRVLRSGGRLVIDDRSVPEDDSVDSCMNQLDRLHDASHIREYRPSEWRRLLEKCRFKVDLIEPYSKQLPLTSLTTDVSPKNVDRIREIVDGLNCNQRKAMNVTQRGGEVYLNHWYVTLLAHPTEAQPDDNSSN